SPRARHRLAGHGGRGGRQPGSERSASLLTSARAVPCGPSLPATSAATASETVVGPRTGGGKGGSVGAGAGEHRPIGRAAGSGGLCSIHLSRLARNWRFADDHRSDRRCESEGVPTYVATAGAVERLPGRPASTPTMARESVAGPRTGAGKAASFGASTWEYR